MSQLEQNRCDALPEVRRTSQDSQQNPPQSDPPRFLADTMLGRLARELRLLGYDTLYATATMADATIAHLAHAEGRILLTRDREMLRRRQLDGILITSDRVQEQVAQLVTAGLLNQHHPFTRCRECNTLLEAVSKEEIAGQVPPYVYATQTHFARCPTCQRIYWRGTHWQRMRQRSVITR